MIFFCFGWVGISIAFCIAAEEAQKLDISAKVGAGEDAEVALFTYLTTFFLFFFFVFWTLFVYKFILWQWTEAVQDLAIQNM